MAFLLGFPSLSSSNMPRSLHAGDLHAPRRADAHHSGSHSLGRCQGELGEVHEGKVRRVAWRIFEAVDDVGPSDHPFENLNGALYPGSPSPVLEHNMDYSFKTDSGTSMYRQAVLQRC